MISCYLTSVEHAEKQIAYRERSVPPLDQKLWTYFGDGKSYGWMWSTDSSNHEDNQNKSFISDKMAYLCQKCIRNGYFQDWYILEPYEH